MNVIQCLRCYDLLAPCMTEAVFRKKCACGKVEIQIINPTTELYKKYRVEVMLHENVAARVVKINNGLILDFSPDCIDFDGEYLKGTLFAEQKSHIVITPLDTPGIKVVKEFTALAGVQKIGGN